MVLPLPLIFFKVFLDTHLYERKISKKSIFEKFGIRDFEESSGIRKIRFYQDKLRWFQPFRNFFQYVLLMAMELQHRSFRKIARYMQVSITKK